MKKMRKGFAIIAATLISIMGLGGVYANMPPAKVYAETFKTDVSNPRSQNLFVDIKGTFLPAEKQKILDRLNEIRYEACKNGYPSYNNGRPDPSKPLTMADYKELKWSNILETFAQIRAVEATMMHDHVRPNSYQETSRDMFYDGHNFNALENASWYGNTMSAIEGWYAEKEAWIKGGGGEYGHYGLMIRPDQIYVGVVTFRNPDASRYKNASVILFCENQDEYTYYIDKNGVMQKQPPYKIPASDEKFTGLSGEHTQTVEVAASNISGISISGSKEITEEESASLSAVAAMKMTSTGSGVQGTTESKGVISQGVKWTSSDTSVLTVDQKGGITAIKAGKATVTAEAADKKASASITVKPKPVLVTGVSINVKSGIKMEQGRTLKLEATVTPDNATNKKLIWSSQLPANASVDQDGVVTGLKVGPTRIFAKSEDGGAEDSKLIWVMPVQVQDVKLDKTYMIFPVGQSQSLKADILPEDARNKNVRWVSDNNKVATVDQTGKVTGVGQGLTNITVITEDGEKKASCKVRVQFSDVTDMKSWEYTPIYWAADRGITTGAGGKFAPAGNCTREQAVTFLWRMWGKPEPKSMKSVFTDVTDRNSYSYKAIMWASENGIVTGAKGKFAPNGVCTREQIVTILWRLAGKPAPKAKTSSFSDVKSPNSYSYKAILWANEKGITTGANGRFSPAGKCLRREMVTFLYRYNRLFKVID